MPEPHLRASDADRAAVADVLGGHLSDGRLTVAEFDDRLTRAYAARTYGELAELTADLPAPARPAAPVAVPAPAPAAGPAGCGGPGWAHGWAGGWSGAWDGQLRPARGVGQLVHHGGDRGRHLGPDLAGVQPGDLPVAGVGDRAVGRRAARPVPRWRPRPAGTPARPGSAAGPAARLTPGRTRAPGPWVSGALVSCAAPSTGREHSGQGGS